MDDHTGISAPPTSNDLVSAGALVLPPRLWGLVVAAGVTAGLVSWYAGEAVDGYYRPALSGVEVMGTVTQRTTAETEAVAEVQNAALVSAILGAALGVALGLAGGLARGDLRAALAASAGGALLGSAAGFGAARLVVPIYQRAYQPLSDSMILPLLSHGAIWSAVGAAGGLAFGAGLGGGARIVRGVLGGLVGGVLGTVAYELVAAAAFPLDRTFQPISLSSSSRLLARFSVTLLASAGAAFATQASIGRRPTRPPVLPDSDPTQALP